MAAQFCVAVLARPLALLPRTEHLIFSSAKLTYRGV